MGAAGRVEALLVALDQGVAALGLLKDDRDATVEVARDPSAVAKRLQIALRQEYDAALISALWMPAMPHLDVKMALAMQCGDEAKHFLLIRALLAARGKGRLSLDPDEGGTGSLFSLQRTFHHPIEQIAAFTAREALAHEKNRQFIAFCRAAGDEEAARVYEEKIQPDEKSAAESGRRFLRKYTQTEEDAALAERVVQKMLALSRSMTEEAVEVMGLSHAPGC